MTFEEYLNMVQKYMDNSMKIIEELCNALKSSLELSNNVLGLYEKDSEKYKTMKSLLERLAPEEYPITKTNVGLLEITRCKYCDTITTMWGECNHASDCPWVEARKLLEELK